MKKRVWWLIILLFLRITIGLFILYKQTPNEPVRVAGNIIKVIHTNNKCIIEVSYFVAESSEFCKYKTGDSVFVFGNPHFDLIEALRGKIVLNEALIAEKNIFLKTTKDPRKIVSPLVLLKNYCTRVYQSFLPSRESALLAGIVLGDKEDIGYDFYQKMVSSGSIHIAVASGFNLMLVGGASLALLFWFLSRKAATLVTIGVMILYAALAGFGAPVLRALVMASFVYLSYVIGRKVDVWWSLFLSAWFMLIWDFGLLWDVSFQLSMAASVGLMVLAPKIVEWASLWGWEAEVEFLEKMSVVSTVAVMALTTPIIWYHFGRVNLVGLFSNIFILPLVPPAMVLGSLMLVLPKVFFVPTYALVHLIVRLIYFFGS